MRRDVDDFTRVLGGRLVFAVEAMGTRVATIELALAAPQWSSKATRPEAAKHFDGRRDF